MVEPITITVPTFCELSGLSRATAWRLIRDGRVTVSRTTGRTLVSYASAKQLLLPDSGGLPSEIQADGDV